MVVGMTEQQQQPKRVLPQNELDLQMMTIDSAWGKIEVPPELRQKLQEHYYHLNEEGKAEITTKSLWGLLGFYTRDMRLANLSTTEMNYCSYYLDLANDLLQASPSNEIPLIKSFLTALSRVATILELSQSKGGFLREQLSTFTQKNINTGDEPKRTLFGGLKNNNKGGGY